MNTTEIFVEQVLIGFMVLLILGLPFLPELSVIPIGDWGTWQGVGFGAGLVGAAYLLGVVFDRAADTFIEDLDRHQRARFALKALIRTQTSNKVLSRKNIILDPGQLADPFPEGRLKTGVLLKGSAPAEQMEYLRTRIRLSRALAVYLPGITFALVLGAGRLPAVDGDGPLLWLAAIPVCYFGVYLGSEWIRPEPKNAMSGRRQGFAVKAPKTHKLKELLRYGVIQGYFRPEKTRDDKLRCSILGKKRIKKRKRISFLCNIFSSRILAISYVFFMLTAILTFYFSIRNYLIIVCLSGYILVFLSVWTWLRISKTFQTLLQNFDRSQTTPE